MNIHGFRCHRRGWSVHAAGTALAIIGVVTSLILAGPVAAEAGTTTTAMAANSSAATALEGVPAHLLMVHGFDDNCDFAFNQIAHKEDPGPNAQKTAVSFAGHGWNLNTGGIDIVGYYGNDPGCTNGNNSNAYWSENGKHCQNLPQGSDNGFNDPIIHLGCLMAWYIYDNYTAQGKTVDILAHSMGGLVVRAAIGLSGQGRATYQDYPTDALDVARVATVGTPHGGLWGQYAKLAAGQFPGVTEVKDMTVGSPFMKVIGRIQRPQGAHGTWWGLVGASQTCNPVVPTNGSLSCIALYPTDGDTSNYPFPDGDGIIQSVSMMSMNADYKLLYGWVQKASAPGGEVRVTDYVAATNTQYSHEADSCLNLVGITLCQPALFYLNDGTTVPTNAWVCSSGCNNGFADLRVDTGGTPQKQPRSLDKLNQLLPAPSSIVGGGNGPGYLRSANNRLFVAAEVGYNSGDAHYGMLRARTAGLIGPWEGYVLVPQGGNVVALRSTQNGLYISAELSYSTSDPLYGMLRARASTVGPWEKFTIVRQGDGTAALRSTANQLYVSAELSYPTSDPLYGMLRARASTVGPWEKFTV